MTQMDRLVEAWETGVEGLSFQAWVKKQLKDAGGYQMDATAWQLLAQLANNMGQSMFQDVQRLATMMKVQTATRDMLRVVIDLRSYENRYKAMDADKVQDQLLIQNRSRALRVRRRLGRHEPGNAEAYQAPDNEELPLRSSSEASSRQRQGRAMRRLHGNMLAPEVEPAKDETAGADDAEQLAAAAAI